MKKFLFLGVALLLAGQVMAQTLKIHQGQVAIALPVEEVGSMQYADEGKTLQIADVSYSIAEIDSMVVSAEPYASKTVDVDYRSNRAFVTLSADVAKMMKVVVEEADVQVWADSLLQEEVDYHLHGNSDNGSFFMEGEFKSTLELDGLHLTNQRGAAIDVANGKRLHVIIKDGTTTTLADGVGGIHKACFFVNGHPEFSGSGTLVLSGNTKHAFASDEYAELKADFGRIEVVKAEGDGMHIEQYFLMKGGEVVINHVKGDGIDVSVTKDAADEWNGQVFIEGGSLLLEVAADDTKGLKCDSAMTISGGTIKAAVSGDGTKGISVGTDLLVQQKTSVSTLIDMTVTGTTYMPDDPDLESKCRGIKVKGNFVFDGGNIMISATGKKSKAISVDGSYTYKSGSINCYVDANN